MYVIAKHPQLNDKQAHAKRYIDYLNKIGI